MLTPILDGEQPIFQVYTKSGHVYRIWEDGRVDGFADVVGICNAIPLIEIRLRKEAAQQRRFADEKLKATVG